MWRARGLQSMAEAPAAGAKRRRLDEEHQVLAGVKQRRTSEQTLVSCLTEHVERIDTDMVPSCILQSNASADRGLL